MTSYPPVKRLVETIPEGPRQRPHWVCRKYLMRHGKPTKARTKPGHIRGLDWPRGEVRP